MDRETQKRKSRRIERENEKEKKNKPGSEAWKKNE